MKNQSRARGQYVGKQMLKKRLMGGVQIWETGKGNKMQMELC